MNLDKSDNTKKRVLDPETYSYTPEYRPLPSDNDEDPWIFLKAALILGVVLGIMGVIMWVGTLLQHCCV